MEWKKVKLGDISTVQTGPFGSQLHQRDYVAQGTPCIMPYNIGSHLDIKTENIAYLRQSDIDRLSRYCVTEGDIIYSRRGDVEKCAYISSSQEGWLCGTGCLRIRPKSEFCNPKFIAYLLSTVEIKSWIVGNAVGTTMLNLNSSILGSLPLSLPSLDDQRRIAAILSSLDDKIENNNRINANLEAQAQALFKSWFVDFEPFGGVLPEDWEETTIGEICKCYLGGTPSRAKAEYWNGEIPWINSGEVNKYRILEGSEYITELGLQKSATKLLPRKTTVLAITGATLGQVSLLEIEACANQSVIGIVQNEKVPYEFIYPLILNDIEQIMLHQTGGAQQHINKDNVESHKLILPTDEVMAKYKAIQAPLFENIASNCFENQRLATLRDTLLPKLMRGEVIV